LLGCFSSKLPQNRHPERSASQIYRVTQRSVRGSKDPGDAYLTHAARSFSTAEARTTRTPHGLSLPYSATLFWLERRRREIRSALLAPARPQV
jgi:hypothetical protein